MATFSSCTILTFSLLAFYHHALALLSCNKNEWKVSFNYDQPEGEASLVFTLPHQKLSSPLDVVTTLSCTDIVVKGSGKISIRLHKHLPSLVSYNISLSRPQNFQAFIKEDKWMNHTCTFTKMSPRITEDETPLKTCKIQFKSFLGRILPNCDEKRSNEILDKLDVKMKQGIVLIYFKNSPNDVVTIDSNCRHGNIIQHIKSDQLERNIFPLTPHGVQPSIVSMDFYPDCENNTVNGFFRDQYLSDCYLEIYSICQEGMTLIKMIEPQFDEEVMHCPPPKSAVTLLSEHLVLAFGITSIPVVLLSSMAIGQIIIVLILLTILVIKFVFLKYYNSDTKTSSKLHKDKKKPLLKSNEQEDMSEVADSKDSDKEENSDEDKQFQGMPEPNNHNSNLQVISPQPCLLPSIVKGTSSSLPPSSKP